MKLRCLLDGLILPASLRLAWPALIAEDGDESFGLEAMEAVYYEVVTATRDEWLALERPYRLLRRAADFRWTR